MLKLMHFKKTTADGIILSRNCIYNEEVPEGNVKTGRGCLFLRCASKQITSRFWRDNYPRRIHLTLKSLTFDVQRLTHFPLAFIVPTFQRSLQTFNV